MTKTFVPLDYEVPESLVTDQYRLDILSPKVTEIDYEAVMSSKVRLRTIFGENTDWPKDDMSLEHNTKDLKRHEEEFKSRKAFLYTVLTLTRDRCIGCVYIEPTKVTEFDCEVYLWVRDSEISLDDHLYNTIHNWLESSWPFKKIAFPGREISWSGWNSYLSKS